MLSAKELEKAVSSAAKRSSAVVDDYVAAPLEATAGGGLELAVDFLVPPVDLEGFTEALETALALTPGRAVVHAVPPGTIHQWCVAWRYAEDEFPQVRWSGDRRAALAGVLRLATVGWRDAAAAPVAG